MKIFVEQIPDEGLELKGEEPAEVVAVTDGLATFPEPLHYNLLATVASGSIIVQGKLWTEAKFECSRCLRKITETVKVDRFLFVEEIGRAQVFDLTEQLREDILLLLPQRALCSPACKGLCSQCGQNLNVKKCKCQAPIGDSRWEALSKLKL